MFTNNYTQYSKMLFEQSCSVGKSVHNHSQATLQNLVNDGVQFCTPYIMGNAYTWQYL